MSDPKTEEQQCANTDRELWRREGGEACDPDNYYQPSIHVTKEGAIGINVGGYVYVKSVEEWHKLAGELAALKEHHARCQRTDEGWHYCKSCNVRLYPAWPHPYCIECEPRPL